MRPEIPSIEDVRQKTEAYLTGSVALDDYAEWIYDWDRYIIDQWIKDHPGVRQVVLSENSAEEMRSTLDR